MALELSFHEQQIRDALDNEGEIRNVKTPPAIVGFGPRQFSPLELRMLCSIVPRALMVITDFQPLDVVYAPRDEQDTALVRALQDYDDLYNLFADFHNALRTIWRRRGLRWMDTRTNPGEAVPDTERTR